MRRRKTFRKTYNKKRKTFGRWKKLPFARNSHIYLGSGFPIGALISVATSLLGPALFQKKFKKVRRKDNYVMMKRATPKRLTLSDGRIFVARCDRVPRSRLPPHMKIRRKYRCAAVRQKGRGIASVIKRLLPFGKKAAKKIMIAALQKI